MVSRLRLCRATQSARASASAIVHIASTSTASYSPKIKVEVIGSKPNGSPKGLGRSPTMVFPGAVKTFTLSLVNSGLFNSDVFGASIWDLSIAFEVQILTEPAGSRYKSRRVGLEQLDDGIGCMPTGDASNFKVHRQDGAWCHRIKGASSGTNAPAC